MFRSLALHECNHVWLSLHLARPHRSAIVLSGQVLWLACFTARSCNSSQVAQMSRRYCSSNACALAHPEGGAVLHTSAADLRQPLACRVILDESHSAKSMNTVQGRACMAIEADRRWVDLVQSLQCCCAFSHGLMCRLQSHCGALLCSTAAHV